ncbi:non-ribosomal peptide synthetase/type I polyketide synthase [Aquimarina sp. Aq78]|uniref:non-ribosomal peptide synthetase/type I polyketide synthase n=1 Tax=Aquimarina sp. Aq78 TaxID=1191889 RepID=UPI00131BD280|nr:non-ribosomal peptide synthetase/type I polyketide synthase [Aquimarina sp. Aq78]
MKPSVPESISMEKTLIEVFDTYLQQSPDKTLYRFLEDGEEESDSRTYQELYNRAQIIASHILEYANQRDRVLLLYPSGLDFTDAFFGCLLAGVVAVPAFPPQGKRRIGRLEKIVSDCNATLVLTKETIYEKTRSWFDSELDWLRTDELSDILKKKLPEIYPDTIAFLQYTSGSTGNPKGVIVNHSNIVHNSELFKKCFRTNSTSVGVSWLPIYHDMGLIGNIIQAFYVGFELIIMPPVAFVQKPVRWLKAFSKYRGTISCGPNFAYDLCTNQIKKEDLEGIDLSSWRVAINGSEPIRPDTFDKFALRFEKYGLKKETLFPGYGMAEVTLTVSGCKFDTPPITLELDKRKFHNKEINVVEPSEDQEDTIRLMGNGPVIEGLIVKIVDPETKQICDSNQIGEVWVNGESVAKGYWEKEEMTKEIFQAFLKNTNGEEDKEQGPFLRTGDMGFLYDGELYISGRLKEMMIFNGVNYYPQDLERTVQYAHHDIQNNAGVVFFTNIDEQERLIVVQEIKRTSIRTYSLKSVVSSICQSILEEHELSVHKIILISPGRVSKTSSGKIQRLATKLAYESDTLDGVIDFWERGVISEKEENLTSEKDSSQKTNELIKWLQEQIAQELNLTPSRININRSFAELGMTSIQGIRLSGELSRYLNRDVYPTLIYSYSNIVDLAIHLSGEENENIDQERKNEILKNEPIAIISMACRFPGAENLQEFWENLIGAKDAITEVPEDRWDIDEFYGDILDGRNMNTRWGGFINNVAEFDADFFEITPQEAKKMDPQQRILLELSYHLLENSLKGPKSFKGSNTGVFIGISQNSYNDLIKNSEQDKNVYSGLGSALSIAANRLSYYYNFDGPSMAIDTACSSSLVAIDAAVEKLHNGKCDMAIAGGVNLIISPEITIALSQAGMMSVDGRCKTFDGSANGYVRSEGCGLVLLTPLSKAQKEGHEILAVIKGSAVNQDGHSNGLSAPNGLAQESVMKKALQDAQITPQTVSYVETHGTGTSLGDPIEVNSINKVYNINRSKENPLYLGAVKANIGHLESASGIAGLIKTVLCLQHNVIPAQLHYNSPNPHINWKDMTVAISNKTLEWNSTQENTVKRAGVSSFGFGGTNAHLILEEVIPDFDKKQYPETIENDHLVLAPVSLKSSKGLTSYYKDIINYAVSNSSISLSTLAHNLALGKEHFSERLAAIYSPNDDITKGLQENKEGIVARNHQFSNLETAFLFTGQGAQYISMGQELYAEQPVFKEAIDTCFLILKDIWDFDLKQLLFSDTSKEKEALLARTEYTQPSLFCIGYALFKVWENWGVYPTALLGHSIGEITAACIAEIFSLEDALKLVVSRGKLMQNLPENGYMMALSVTETIAMDLIKDLENKIVIAAVNSPNHIVLSGETEPMSLLEEILSSKKIPHKKLNVSHAFHSPLMEPMLKDFEEVASKIKYHNPKYNVVSNVYGKVSGGELCNSSYWVSQIKSTVLFSQGISELCSIGINTFIELGPHPTLTSLGQYSTPKGYEAIWLPSLQKRKEDNRVLLNSLATWYVEGGTVNWENYYRNAICEKQWLPNYQFQKQRYWVDDVQTGKEEKQYLYDYSWEKENLEVNDVNNIEGHYLIIGNKETLDTTLIESVEMVSTKVDYVDYNEFKSFEKLDSITNIIVTWHFFERNRKMNFGEFSEETTLAGATQLQEIITLFENKRLSKLSHFWWVTSGVYAGSETGLSLSPLLGLSRVFMNEHPDISMGIIDIDYGDIEKNTLSTVWSRATGREQYLYKDNEVLGLKLTRYLPDSTPKASLTLSPDKAILITGGLGEIGLEVSKWLIEHTESNRIVLIGRNQPTKKAQSKIEELHKLGGEIITIKADVADRESIEKCIKEIQEIYTIQGVIHLAGVIDDNVLVDQTPERFTKVLVPKVSGAWYLHEATKSIELEFFVLFSSIASVFGSSGQSNYAAANSFLDGLATYRRNNGLVANTINWGTWTIGSFSNLSKQEKNRIAQSGISPISKEVGFDLLHKIITKKEKSNLLCADIDSSKLQQQLLNFYGRIPSFYKEIILEKKAESNVVINDFSFIDKLRNLAQEDRANFLQEELKKEVCNILSLQTVAIDQPLLNFGLDSLMALELRNRLANKLKKKLPNTILFQFPTIIDCVTYLLNEIENDEKVKEDTVISLQKTKRQDTIPASYAQEALWFIDQLQGSKEYHVFRVLELSGLPDKEVLGKSLTQLINKHEILRTVIVNDDNGNLYQKIQETEDFKVNHLYLENRSELDTEIRNILNRPFDLSSDVMFRATLIETTTSENFLIFVLHHIAADGVSDAIIFDEFLEAYQAFSAKKEIHNDVLDIQYAEYAIWEREYLKGITLESMLDYWKNKLEGHNRLQLPFDFSYHQKENRRGKKIEVRLDDALRTELIYISKQEGVTLFMTMLSVFKVMMYRYSGQDDICIGTPVANRTEKELEHMVGMFVNTLVLRSDLSGNPNFRSLLQQIRQITLEAYENQSVPFEKVVEKVVTQRDFSGNPIFQVMFGAQSTTDIDKLEVGNLKVSEYKVTDIPAMFDLTFTMDERKDHVLLIVEYCADLFREDTIYRMISHYNELLKSVIENIESSIDTLSMQSIKEKNQLLYEFNDTQTDYPLDKALVDLLQEKTKQIPNKTAIVFEEITLTYKELDERSNQLAHYLREKGIKEDVLVPICLERSIEMVVAILAVFKAGGAYVPMKPDYPESRMRYILDQIQAKIVLTDDRTSSIIPENDKVEIFKVDSEKKLLGKYPVNLPDLIVSPDSLSYVIYTSGSTGKPKGAMIEHRGMLNHLFAKIDGLGVTADSVVAFTAPFTFDISVWQMFSGLLVGGSIVIYKEEMIYEPTSLLASIKEHKVNILQLVPSYVSEILNIDSENVLNQLTYFIVTGEAVSPALLVDWFNKYPTVPVANAYGPTEASDDVSTHYMHSAPDVVNVSIGKPMSNLQLYVVDSSANLCPIGVQGELWVSGIGVGRGYLNDKERTNKSFINNPFVKGERIYKTGDLARWLPDGSLEYLGRIDNQVKVRGHRIELGEIENVLSKSETVKSCCVLARKDHRGSNRLIGYVVSENEFDKIGLQSYLKSKLPEYMVPGLWVNLDKMPLTPNGKINRKGLPDPDESEFSTQEYTAPTNEIETQMVTVWENLLGIDKIGIHDGFFELGGHSLLATRLVSELRKLFNVEVTIKDIFEFTTIEQLALCIQYAIDTQKKDKKEYKLTIEL